MTIKDIEPETNVFPYLHLAIGFILADYAFKHYLDIRQLNRKLRSVKIPKAIEFLEVKEEDYQKSRLYTISKLRFSLVVDTFKTVLECFLIYFFYGPWLWNFSGELLTSVNLDPNSEFNRGITYFFLDMIRGKIIETPISYYLHFVLEEKYGFNKMTMDTFVKDELKTLALTAVITPPVLYVILWVIEAGGEYFYIYVEIVLFVIMIIMMIVYPNFIAPLFNKFEDLPAGPLLDKINKLADRLSYPLKKIFVCDGSKRSNHSNAYLYGFWKNKRIVLFDTLLNHLDHDEIEGVLGHELGHWKKGHTWKMLIWSLVQIFLTFYVYGFFMYNKAIFQSFGFKDQSIFIGLQLFSMIYAPVGYVLGLVNLRMTRAFEYQADEFSTNLGYGEKLSTGLTKMFKENAGDMDPDPVYAAFNYSHPALIERLNFISDVKKRL